MASITSVKTWWKHFSVAPSAVKLWASDEFARRSRLKREDFCDTVLLSYPRSGNHLARYLIEHLLERPTLGEVDEEKFRIPRNLPDAPILTRLGNRSYKSLKPIAVKRHGLVAGHSFKRMVFVARDPIDAILSHTRNLEDEGFEQVVESEVQKYLDNLEAFLSHQDSSRLLVRYQDLLERTQKAVGALTRFLGQEGQYDAARQYRVDTAIAKRALVREPSQNPGRYELQFSDRAERVRDLLNDAGAQLRETGINY